MKTIPRIVGIVGYPMSFTLSPAIHNAAFRRMGLPFVYLPFAVEGRYLRNLLRCMRLMDVEGLNVTAPHKEAVCALLPRLDPAARRIGAVNTIALRRGRYTGYNTDAPAFLTALRRTTGATPAGRRVTVIGAGGAARAVADACGRAGAAAVTIANRTPARARALAASLRGAWRGCRVTAIPCTRAALRATFRTTDLLVHATSATAAPAPSGNRPWLPLAALPPAAVVADLHYAAKPTPIVQRASALGLQAVDGLTMLIEQAALSFALWTGKTMDRRHARRIAHNALIALKKAPRRAPPPRSDDE